MFKQLYNFWYSLDLLTKFMLSFFAGFLTLIVLSIIVNIVSVEYNEEVVLVDKPLLPFFSEGVRSEPVTTGRKFIFFTTNAIKVSMIPTRINEPFNDIMTKDGVPLDFQATLTLQVTDSVRLIKNYGVDFYKDSIQVEIQKYVRSAVKMRGMNETAIEVSALDKIDEEVTDNIRSFFKEQDIPVRLINFTVGRANPPDSVLNQRIATAEQEQRTNTENKRIRAEEERKKAESARALADNAYRSEMNLTPEQFVRLEQIKATKEMCTAKGAVCSFLIGVENPVVVGK